uniref:Secreted protein n=1 Tax=Rhipicephalus appendiculatus TaxID=34631 RepID=A0A131YB43_RHIAP
MTSLYLHLLAFTVPSALCETADDKVACCNNKRAACGSQSLLLALPPLAPFASFDICHRMHASKTPVLPSRCHTHAYSCVTCCPFTCFIRPELSFIVTLGS